MQLLTAKEITSLKTTATAMYSALEIVEDVFCSTLDTTLVAMTSPRAIAGYKAVYSILMILALCCQYAYLWLRREFAPVTSRPPIVGELVTPAPTQESTPDPWQEPEVVTVLVPELIQEIREGRDQEQPAIAGLLPASPVKTARKPRAKKDGTTTPKTTSKRSKKVVATV